MNREEAILKMLEGYKVLFKNSAGEVTYHYDKQEPLRPFRRDAYGFNHQTEFIPKGDYFLIEEIFKETSKEGFYGRACSRLTNKNKELIEAIDSFIRQDHNKGYPTGSEWRNLITEAKKLLSKYPNN